MARVPWWVALIAAGCGSAVTQPDAVRTTVLLSEVGGRSFVELGAASVYVGGDFSTGDELWRTDGTPQGTRLVKDIEPGPRSSGPFGAARHGDVIFFAASTSEHGNELWRSDGTETGTFLVRDIDPGPGFESGFDRGDSHPGEIVSVGAFVAFRACDQDHGNELWRSDGTWAGTALVADIDPGRGADTRRLHCGDNPGPRDLTVVRGVVYFLANHPAFGTELWRSDGTSEGTWMVTEVYPGPDPPPVMRSSGVPVANLVASQDRLFFLGPGGLWTSDGTAAGTRPIGMGGARLVAGSSRAYFVGFPGSGLWTTDGTAEGTRMLTTARLTTDVRFEGRLTTMSVLGDVLFFEANDGVTGNEPWRSDGTSAGTAPLGDLNPGFAGSSPDGFVAVAGRVFFLAGSDGLRLYAAGATGPATPATEMVFYDRSPSASLGVVGETVLVSATAFNEGPLSDGQLWAYRAGR